MHALDEDGTKEHQPELEDVLCENIFNHFQSLVELRDVADVAIAHELQSLIRQLLCCLEAGDLVNAPHDGEDNADITVDIEEPQESSLPGVDPTESL